MICCICKIIIPKDREEGLITLGASENKATCLSHAVNSRVRGIYAGESGLSPLIIVDSLGEHGISREGE